MCETVQSVPIRAVVIDSETQPRAEIMQDTIKDYREAIEGGDVLPPVTLFFDGERYWIGDGFHRIFAYRAAGFREVDATIRPGGKRDAILHAVGANHDHGLPRKNADKRRAVEILLRDKEWQQWSDGVIADRCRVHQTMVGHVRKAMYPLSTQDNLELKRKGKDGRTRDTTNCGKRRKATEQATPPPPPAPKPKPAPEPKPAPPPPRPAPDPEPEEPDDDAREAVAAWFQPTSDLAAALAELREIRMRYGHVAELSDVFAAIDRLARDVA